MKILRLPPQLADSEVADLKGEFLDERHYDARVNYECTGYDESTGNVLFMLLKNALPLRECRTALHNLNGIGSTLTNTNRKTAIGPGSGDETSRETYIGFMNRSGGWTPYCRSSQFNQEHPDKWEAVQPFILSADAVFKLALPDRPAVQLAHVQGAKQDWVIARTAFSSIQVNTNVRTKAHTDKGDLSEGFGVISLLTQGLFTGGELIIPRFRLVIASEMTDLLLVNVHEVHANAPVTKFTKEYSRVATVFHYRTGLQQCGTPDEEAERLNNLQLR